MILHLKRLERPSPYRMLLRNPQWVSGEHRRSGRPPTPRTIVLERIQSSGPAQHRIPNHGSAEHPPLCYRALLLKLCHGHPITHLIHQARHANIVTNDSARRSSPLTSITSAVQAPPGIMEGAAPKRVCPRSHRCRLQSQLHHQIFVIPLELRLRNRYPTNPSQSSPLQQRTGPGGFVGISQIRLRST